MTKKLTFTGCSDYLFCVSIDGVSFDEIDTCGNGKAIYSLQSEDDRMLVIGEYLYGIWMIGISQITKGVSIPNWNISITNNPCCDYSPKLTLACPDDISVTNLSNVEL